MMCYQVLWSVAPLSGNNVGGQQRAVTVCRSSRYFIGFDTFLLAPGESSCCSIRRRTSQSSDAVNSSPSFICLNSILVKAHPAGEMLHDLVLCFCRGETIRDHREGSETSQQRKAASTAQSGTASFLRYCCCCSLILVFHEIGCFGRLPAGDLFNLRI